MERKQIIQSLNETGMLLELLGENYFKARAYYQSAEIIAGLPKEPAEYLREGEEPLIPGIGAAISKKIAELVRTGKLPYLDKMREQVPPELPHLLKVPGLGAKRINTLWKKAGITSLPELEQACREDRLLGIPGFGSKTQEKILAGLAVLHTYEHSFLWFEIIGTVAQLQGALKGIPGVCAVEVTGDLRRRLEIVSGITLVVISSDTEAVKAAIPAVAGWEGMDEEKENIKGKYQGYPAALHLSSPDAAGTILWQTTGSDKHLKAVMENSKEKNFPPATAEEAGVYAAAHLPYIPPELREDGAEVLIAEKGLLPQLVEEADIRGAFHIHTTYSDGVHTPEEMVRKAAEMGWEYIGIADHSQSAFYAGGLKPEALDRQREELQALEKKYGIRIFKGVESDILPDGNLDYPPGVLAKLDYVVGSIHSNFRQDRETMTRRICAALASPYLTILGHPTGRILLSREGYEVDLEQVIETAAKYRKIIEINASPYRLDLDWRWCRLAKSLGVKFAVNPDAHSVHELGLAVFGIGVARKGWLTKGDVVNAWERERVIEYLIDMRKLDHLL